MAIKKFKINRLQAAYLLGVDERSLSTWQKRRNDPLPVLRKGTRGTPNEYDPAALLQWYVRQELAKVITTDKGEYLNLDAERARLAKEQADGLELKNAIARREQAPITLLESALSDVGSQMAAVLASIPLKVKRRLPKLSASEIEIINREVIKAQNAARRVRINFDNVTGTPE